MAKHLFAMATLILALGLLSACTGNSGLANLTPKFQYQAQNVGGSGVPAYARQAQDSTPGGPVNRGVVEDVGSGGPTV